MVPSSDVPSEVFLTRDHAGRELPTVDCRAKRLPTPIRLWGIQSHALHAVMMKPPDLSSRSTSKIPRASVSSRSSPNEPKP